MKKKLQVIFKSDSTGRGPRIKYLPKTVYLRTDQGYIFNDKI